MDLGLNLNSVILNKFLNISKLESPHLQSEHNNNASPGLLLWLKQLV